MNGNVLSFTIAIGAFGLFIVCPRMAAMTNLIARNFQFSIYWLVIIGTLLSIPLLLIMTWVIRQWGLMAGLGFAILTDFLSALIISPISIKAGVETFIIALFVVAGNRISVWITGKLF